MVCASLSSSGRFPIVSLSQVFFIDDSNMDTPNELFDADRIYRYPVGI